MKRYGLLQHPVENVFDKLPPRWHVLDLVVPTTAEIALGIRSLAFVLPPTRTAPTPYAGMGLPLVVWLPFRIPALSRLPEQSPAQLVTTCVILSATSHSRRRISSIEAQCSRDGSSFAAAVSTGQRRKRLPTSIPAQRSLIFLIRLLLVAEELTRKR